MLGPGGSGFWRANHSPFSDKPDGKDRVRVEVRDSLNIEIQRLDDSFQIRKPVPSVMVKRDVPVAPQAWHCRNRNDEHATGFHEPNQLSQGSGVVLDVFKNVHRRHRRCAFGGQGDRFELGLEHSTADGLDARSGDFEALVVIVEPENLTGFRHLFEPGARAHPGVDQEIVGLELDRAFEPVTDDRSLASIEPMGPVKPCEV